MHLKGLKVDKKSNLFLDLFKGGRVSSFKVAIEIREKVGKRKRIT